MREEELEVCRNRLPLSPEHEIVVEAPPRPMILTQIRGCEPTPGVRGDDPLCGHPCSK